MRTEFTIKITDSKGDICFLRYGARKYADEAAQKAKEHSKVNGNKVEYFKTRWSGKSFVEIVEELEIPENRPDDKTDR